MAKWHPEESLLQDYWTEHLPYEFSMLELTYDYLKLDHGDTINNALIESFSIHARNLIEFFRDKQDVHASHFTAAPYSPKFVGANSGALGDTRYKKLIQQVAHMTKDRTIDDEKKIGGDDRDKIIGALRKEKDRFLSRIDERFVLPDQDSVRVGSTLSTSSAFSALSLSMGENSDPSRR